MRPLFIVASTLIIGLALSNTYCKWKLQRAKAEIVQITRERDEVKLILSNQGKAMSIIRGVSEAARETKKGIEKQTFSNIQKTREEVKREPPSNQPIPDSVAHRLRDAIDEIYTVTPATNP